MLSLTDSFPDFKDLTHLSTEGIKWTSVSHFTKYLLCIYTTRSVAFYIEPNVSLRTCNKMTATSILSLPGLSVYFFCKKSVYVCKPIIINLTHRLSVLVMVYHSVRPCTWWPRYYTIFFLLLLLWCNSRNNFAKTSTTRKCLCQAFLWLPYFDPRIV